MASRTQDDMMRNGPSGWVSFAGVMMIVVGFFQAIAGLVAIFKPELYVTTANHLFLLDFTQWGWVHLIFGLIVMFSSGSLFAGRLWGRFLAIMLATVSAVLNFSFIWAYPVWSIMIIVLDVVVIYSVVVYNGTDME